MKRGDVFYLRYDNSYGHEMATGRPIVVLSSEEGIATSPVVQVAFLTTSPRHTGVEIEINSLRRRSWVVCTQLNTVDKDRLDTPNGRLTDLEMSRVDQALLEVFGLKKYIEEEVEPESEVIEPPVVENSWVNAELELYKDLYTKAMAKLAEVRFDYDMLRLEKKTAVVEKPVVEPAPTPELDLSGLKKVANVRTEKPVGKKVNINTATAEEIHNVTGLGTFASKRITQFRKTHGAYKRVEDILQIDAIGPRSFKMIAPFMEV